MRALSQREAWLSSLLNSVALALSFVAWGTWFALALWVLCGPGASVVSEEFRKIVFFDALPPGRLSGALLAAAALARRWKRIPGARLLEFAGLAALVTPAALMAFAARELELSTLSSQFTFMELAAAAELFLGAKIVSAIVIGAIRWIDRRASNARAPAIRHRTEANITSLEAQLRPVSRLQDLFSFLVVLSVWFCVVPMPRLMASSMPIFVPGPVMFVAGFPVGLVGVAALFAAGLLRGSHDRQRVVGLELFGIAALAMLQIAAALPFAQQVNGIHPDLIRWVLAWTLFGTLIGAKLILIAFGLVRRSERLQFTLLGLLAFTLGCGALLMYWRAWQS